MDAPVKFRVNCTCGDFVLVSEGAAGATFACSCGKAIQIPSSTQLRIIAGQPIAPPEEVIEGMLLSGAMPSQELCACCDCKTHRIIRVLTVCERAQTRQSGGFSWGVFVFSLIFLPIRILHWEAHEEQILGRDKIYPLPLFVCEKCDSALSDTATLKRCLSKVPEYRQLLEKFPNATLSVVK